MSFPYRIFNDISAKLKAAEANIDKVRKYYEAKIATLIEEYEEKLGHVCCEVSQVSVQALPNEPVEEELDDEVYQLKNKVSQLVYENNRYHLMLSNCTMCSDDTNSDDLSSFFDASTPQTFNSESSIPLLVSPSTAPAPLVFPGSAPSPPVTSTMPPMIPSISEKKRCAVGIQKDQANISRLVSCLSKLEQKYSTPPHKRKARLFKRKKRTNNIIPREFASIFDNLAHTEPEELNQVSGVGTIYPEVKWNLVKFKTVLSPPETCPLYSCSQDPSFYEDHILPGCSLSQFVQKNPFGSRPGFVTNLGVVAVPEAPIGGYVYCPDARRWLIHATIPTTEGGGRSSKGSPFSRGRRKG